MISNIAISNIINQRPENKNIYYHSKQNMFSVMLEDDIEKNIIYEPNQPFSCIITDDPIQYSQIIDNISIKYHTNSIILFHSGPMKLLKKEDKRILYSKLQSSYKIFFGKTIQSEWSFPYDNKTFCIDYGIPIERSFLHDSISNKNKHIAIINFKEHKEINYLFEHLKNYLSDVDLITNIDCNYQQLIKKLSNYKIVICLNDPFSAISLAALGCYVFSNDDQYKQQTFKNIIYTEEVSSIINQVSGIKYEEQKTDIINNANKILDTYCANNFYTNFHKIINQAIGKPYVHQA